MSSKFQFLLLGLSLACAFGQQQQPPVPPAKTTTADRQPQAQSSVVFMEQKSAQRGETVSIRIPSAPESTDVEATLNGRPVRAEWHGKVLSFLVPDDWPLGESRLSFRIDRETYPARELRVIASPTAPVLERVEPATAYPTGGKIPVLKMFGAGFAPDSAQHQDDIRLLLDDSQQDVIWHESWAAATEGCKSGGIHAAVINPSELRFCNVPVGKQGALRVNLFQGARLEPKDIVITRWNPWTIRVVAFVVAAGLVLLVYWLLGFKGEHRIKGESYQLRAMFLDKQTNTYSLSILQFQMWTAAALFGYAYYALARLFVQQGGIPEVSGGLPAIVGVGLGATTAIAAQIVGGVNPKGSGDEAPSPSDLVTSGGAIAPDRVQMLVWTFIGVGVFLAGVLREDPATMQGLPAIPESLMALMGLSSLGYLGGKFARKPGPNILELSVIPGTAQTASAPSAGAAPIDLTQPVAVASQAAQSVKAAAAGLSGSSAPEAVKEATAAVTALDSALATAAAIQQSGSGGSGVAKLVELSNSANSAAVNAAAEFDRLNGTAGSEIARLSASIAQRVASAVEDLAASVGSIVAMVEDAAARRAREESQSLRRVIEFRGNNLSADGVFRAKVGVNEYDIPFRMLEEKDNRRAPEIVVPEESTGNAKFARTLRLSIVPSRLEPADRRTYDAIFGSPGTEISFIIFNPDGQKATKSITFPPGEAQRA